MQYLEVTFHELEKKLNESGTHIHISCSTHNFDIIRMSISYSVDGNNFLYIVIRFYRTTKVNRPTKGEILQI